jgi:hypothetical protein
MALSRRTFLATTTAATLASGPALSAAPLLGAA